MGIREGIGVELARTIRNVDPHIPVRLLDTQKTYLAPFGRSLLLSKTDRHPLNDGAERNAAPLSPRIAAVTDSDFTSNRRRFIQLYAELIDFLHICAVFTNIFFSFQLFSFAELASDVS